MTTGTREVLLNQYLNASSPLRDFYNDHKKHRNQNKARRQFAMKSLWGKGKKYEYQLFIGDSKTPLGTFMMELPEAKEKNKKYEDKLFYSKDDSYRLRVLRLSESGKAEFWKDVEDEMFEIAKKYREVVESNN